MRPTQRIEELISPSLAAMGYDVVRARLSGRDRPVLQVMIERNDRQPMTVESCAEASHAISAILDVEDPIRGAYVLEVSSPGIDRPLVRLADYERFAGHVARLELAAPINGRKRFRGRLMGIEGETIRLIDDDGLGAAIDLPFAAIEKAKLVLTDELIAATRAESKA
ncbi:MAG: ribosome maturation factor RimP [Alphaproteobacteria bacterium]|nr:ribosome maturation factor RimP [Alphaproteobacteria bacterium]